MFIHYKNHVAYARGSAIRNVNCERCSCRFEYTLERTTVGNSPLSRDRAARGAQRQLKHVMETAVDLVRCPTCGRLQMEMVREWRMRRLSGLRAIAIFVLYFALLIGLLWAGVLWSTVLTTPDEWRDLVTWSAIPVGIAALVLIGRRIIVSFGDPNAGYPQRFGNVARE